MKMAWILELDEKLLEDLYLWIDNIPLSKSKKRIERDFSDGKNDFSFHLSLTINNKKKFSNKK